jgi:phosphoserine phosphatase
MTSAATPLCVDLDGTLIAADTLFVSFRELVRRKPWALPALPFALLAGRARLKERIADFVAIDAAALPYRPDVVAFLREEKAAGRCLILTTAADARIAHAVASHLGLFDAVIASGGGHNAKGEGKVASIRAHLGSGEFDYMGDHLADLPVLKAARRGYLVYPTPALLATARTSCRIERVFGA